MANTKERLLQAAGRIADTAVTTGTNLVAKGKQQADLMALQLRLKKAQQRLGALVYSLHKSGERAEGTVARCVQEIDVICEQIRALEQPKKRRVKVHNFNTQEGKERPDAFFVAASVKNYPQKQATVVTFAPKTDAETKKPAAKSEKT